LRKTGKIARSARWSSAGKERSSVQPYDKGSSPILCANEGNEIPQADEFFSSIAARFGVDETSWR